MHPKVFVDSDVVISSLLSQKGAAASLINGTNLKRFISNKSEEEIERVALDLNIDKKEVQKVVDKRFSKVALKDSLEEIKEKYSDYVKDPNDAHIVAGAHTSKAKFIISYNQKDFNPNKIKEDFILARFSSHYYK